MIFTLPKRGLKLLAWLSHVAGHGDLTKFNVNVESHGTLRGLGWPQAQGLLKASRHTVISCQASSHGSWATAGAHFHTGLGMAYSCFTALLLARCMSPAGWLVHSPMLWRRQAVPSGEHDKQPVVQHAPSS